MPIKIPDDLPARSILEGEGIVVIGQDQALHQDIRPLKIALLNLMPKKIPTETQFARVCGSTPLQVEFTLLKMAGHIPKNTPPSHMATFYRSTEEVAHETFDGVIVTGAPVEHLEFEDVSYWRHLTDFFDWANSHVHSLFCVCWGAQAALYHRYQIPKYPLGEKISGIFEHQVLVPSSPYLHGFCDDVPIPVSRWTETRLGDVAALPHVRVLLSSLEAGLALLEDTQSRTLYMLNHLEYDTNTLREEYERDLLARKGPQLPKYYFPKDNPAHLVRNTWRAHGHLLFRNWITEVYRTTPFHLEEIGKESRK